MFFISLRKGCQAKSELLFSAIFLLAEPRTPFDFSGRAGLFSARVPHFRLEVGCLRNPLTSRCGWMGEVYRARDTKLGREVAIKVLPEAFSNSEEKLARFEREARLLASLNHPNVATLYGLEKEDGVPFLAMELVEGETLGERIGRGSIPLDEALPFFTQIAAGLEAAHEKGIVHRDLKPANIKVTPEGKVKVLDFGLGKAMAGEPTSVDLSQSPTLTREGTATSVILGTAPYMSPEQARGKPVDKRTDVWAFGCVLYEALTARVAFPGETVSDTIVSILKQDPDWQALPEETPAAVRSLLRRCLRKDLERRQHDIADARIEIEDALSAPHESATRTGESPRSLPRTGLVMALLLAVLIGLGTGWIVFRHTARTIDASLRQLTANPVENMVSGAAISADGTYVAYTDSTGTWVRVLETGETRLLPETEGRHFWEVSWFPDGTKLLATGPSESGDQVSLYAISILGGAPRKLRDNGWRGSVSPDGSRIVYLNASPPPSHEVWLMDANGSNAKIIASGKDRNFWQAAWTPDGQRVLYGALRVEGFESYIESYELEGEKTAMVLSDDRLWQFWRGVLPFVWTPDDQLICAVREPPPNHGYSNLWKFKIDKGQGRAVGTPTRITNLVGVNFRDLRLTADGKLLTFLRQRNQVDVYLAEIAEGGQHLGTPRRLTLDERTDMPSGWAADSRSVLFSSDRGGNRDVYQQSIDGTVAQVVVQGPENEGGAQFSPDGSMILYWSGGSLQRVPLRGARPQWF